MDDFKRLPPELSKNGFQYTLVSRGLRTCIYCQHVTPNFKCYEVFLIKTRPAEVLFGKQVPAREVLPSNESFGSTAWVFRNKERAIKRFNSLENNL